MPEANIPTLETSLSATEQLSAAADTRGIELDQDRANRLIEIAKYRDSVSRDSILIFEEDGLKIKRPQLMSTNGVPLSLVSALDFLPQVDKDSEIIANPNPQRGRTTQITLMGINAFQDFVLLADAGLVAKPERFFSKTNPTMAKVAKRIGFRDTPRSSEGVTATYEDVATRVFSPDILDIQQRFQQRQEAAQSAGALVINS